MLHSLLCSARYVWGLIFFCCGCGSGFVFLVHLEFCFAIHERMRIFVICAYECSSAVTRGSSAPGRQTDLFPYEGIDQVRQHVPLGSSRAWAR